MERNFTDENFEDFLRGQAGSFRMRPSEDVWKGVRRGLVRKRRRLMLAFGSLAAAASLFGYFLIDFTVGEASIVKRETTDVRKSAGGDRSTVDGPPSTEESLQSTVRSTQPAARIVPLYPDRTLAYNESAPVAVSAVDRRPSTVDPIAIDDSRFTIDHSPLTVDRRPSTVDSSPDQPVNESTDEPTVDRGPSTVDLPTTQRRARKTSFQLSVTPTVSYRKLSEDGGLLQGGVPRTGGFLSLNSLVNHKPDVGFEVGLSARRSVAPGLKARAGVQFNVNRYSISAHTSVSEIANIPLSSNNRIVDSFSTISSHRVGAGTRPNWLQNYYFQVSAPVGLELKLFQAKNGTEIGVASTLQPTYILGDRAYLLSSDLKNYAEVPWLIRRVNVNTNFETFIAYSTGKVRWQVGPQVRYQLLSSFRSKYPVKENLFDYGLKVGLSINR